LAFVLTDRLPMFDRQQLLNLRSNARRLQADEGPRGDEAKAMLPLIEEELSKRVPAPAKPRAPAKKKAAPPLMEEALAEGVAAAPAKPRAKKKA
jgi:hypothetical protein